MQLKDGKDPVLDCLTDISPGVVTGYVLIVECVDTDGDTAVCIDALGNQSTSQTLGLLAYGDTLVKSDLWEGIKNHSCPDCQETE
jgi:hypothetical protein